ncbi:MAG TPA: SAM-dependent methyltransferase [Solirubrobacteraceae bacterium]|nr:SAM-dependent methyltransferase [Solirubrobacteraceae bacterium]
MRADRASMTAIGTSLMRAAHARLDDPVLLRDLWGERLIHDDERGSVRAAHGDRDVYEALRRHPSYGNVILRARYTEDALEQAVARGVGQYVIVGAGLDTFALRRPPFAAELSVFEVDHPATQRFKRERLAEVALPEPAGLHFVAADLGEIPLDEALSESPFDAAKETFFAWLGVTPYLTREANLATLRAIVTVARAAGGELVFSYLDQRVFESDSWPERTQRVRDAVAAAGEPWVSGFEPDRLGELLAGLGFELLENLAPDELAARYRASGLEPSRNSYIARARVATES